MTKRTTAALLLSCATLAAASAARAAAVVAVLSADHGVYRQALDGFDAAFGSSVPVRLASADPSLDPDTKVVVAIGGRAALRAYPASASVVYCLAPVSVELRSRKATRVRMVPRPPDLISRLRAAQPRARAVAILWSQSAYESYAAALVAEGRKAGLQVLSVPTDSAALPRDLIFLRGKADALWLAPDPLLVTPDTFQVIASFARRASIAFYAPSAALVAEGATAAIAVSAEDIGRAAAAIAKEDLAGQDPPADTYPDRVQVVVDPARAAAAGLVLSSEVVKTPPPAR